jgi:hypothetical protein
MGLRIANALLVASFFAWLSYVWWLKQGYRKSAFGYLSQDLLERDKQASRWISRFVFLVIFLLHFFFIGAS